MAAIFSRQEGECYPGHCQVPPSCQVSQWRNFKPIGEAVAAVRANQAWAMAEFDNMAEFDIVQNSIPTLLRPQRPCNVQMVACWNTVWASIYRRINVGFLASYISVKIHCRGCAIQSLTQTWSYINAWKCIISNGRCPEVIIGKRIKPNWSYYEESYQRGSTA